MSKKKKFRTVGTSSIGGRITKLGYASYAEYLASDVWKSKRRKWYAQAEEKDKCHALNCIRGQNLALHHRTYERLGDEQMADLVLVCPVHHKEIHRLERTGLTLAEATDRVLKVPFIPAPKPTHPVRVPYSKIIEIVSDLVDTIEGMDGYSHVESQLTGIRLQDHPAYKRLNDLLG